MSKSTVFVYQTDIGQIFVRIIRQNKVVYRSLLEVNRSSCYSYHRSGFACNLNQLGSTFLRCILGSLSFVKVYVVVL